MAAKLMQLAAAVIRNMAAQAQQANGPQPRKIKCHLDCRDENAGQ
jgi:hypothetical protein